MKAFTGYVATLDVLGFSELLYREGYAQKLQLYLDTINDVIRPTHVKVECVVFSDSIVLTSTGGSDDSFRGLVSACSATIYELLRCGMPVRGAVAFGRYWRETSGGSVFLAGRPIVEAYRCERGQKWVGVILCPSVLHEQGNLGAVVDLASLTEDDVGDYGLALRVQPAAVPFRDDGAAMGQLSAYAIVPLAADDQPRRAYRTVRRVSGYLEDLRLKAPDPAAQGKYTASLTWLANVETALKTFSQRIAMPATKKAS